jgi:hypothetical protein
MKSQVQASPLSSNLLKLEHTKTNASSMIRNERDGAAG